MTAPVRWLLLLALSLPLSAAAQKQRFEMDLGLVDLERVGHQEYKLPALPEGEMAFGLKLTHPEGGKAGQLPKATVRMTLVNERDEVVFDTLEVHQPEVHLEALLLRRRGSRKREREQQQPAHGRRHLGSACSDSKNAGTSRRASSSCARGASTVSIMTSDPSSTARM